MIPAGSITFLPKIHGPVSTIKWLRPAMPVASSTLPIPPSIASTENPTRLVGSVAASENVQISIVVWVRSLSIVPPLGVCGL